MSRYIDRPADAMDRLAGLSLLSALDADALEAVAAVVRWRILDLGDVLFREGDPGDTMVVLVQGRLAITRERDGRTQWVRVAMPGESVGELGMLSGEARSADVVALRRCLLLELDQADWFGLAGQTGGLSSSLLHMVVDWLRPRSGAVRREPSVLALLPASRNAPLAQLAQDLGEALPGDVARLDRRAASDALGAHAIDLEALGAWVAAREDEGRRVVLCGDERDPPWSNACSQVADAALLVADPAAAPLPLPGGVRLACGPVRTAQLVLVHDPATVQPTGTRAWLERYGLREHHHLRLRRGAAPSGRARDDLFRLVRRLTGTAVSVAFGGGAARGLAHVGAVRALEELRVPIDQACGTSMGGIVAAEVALGRSADELASDMDRYFSSYFMLRPRLLPAVSAMSDRPLRSLCDALFRRVEVEDCWRALFTVSSNLTLARPEIMDTGTVSFAVRASGAVPGMWPPVARGEHVLVDGVVTNNLPGDLAIQRQPGHGIAINVIPRADPQFDAAHYTPSATRAVLRRINPLSRHKPPLVTDIGLRSLFMATVQHAEAVREAMSVFIEPEVGRFGFLLEAHRGPQIIEAGYRAALEAVAAWLEAGPDLPGR